MSVIFSQDLTFSLIPKGIIYGMKHPNETSKYMLEKGIFEQDIIALAKKFANKNKVFVDIGAHIGTYTMNLTPLFKETWSFEAQRDTFYYLCGNIALNNLSHVVQAKNCAVSNKEDDGKLLTLKIISEDGGGSSIRNLQNNQNFLTTEKVISKPLDYFQIKNIGLIKIDVEGAEIDVIKGASDTLKASNYPPILFEAWPDDWFKEQREILLAFIESIGYKIEKVNFNMYLALK